MCIPVDIEQGNVVVLGKLIGSEEDQSQGEVWRAEQRTLGNLLKFSYCGLIRGWTWWRWVLYL